MTLTISKSFKGKKENVFFSHNLKEAPEEIPKTLQVLKKKNKMFLYFKKC